MKRAVFCIEKSRVLKRKTCARIGKTWKFLEKITCVLNYDTKGVISLGNLEKKNYGGLYL